MRHMSDNDRHAAYATILDGIVTLGAIPVVVLALPTTVAEDTAAHNAYRAVDAMNADVRAICAANYPTALIVDLMPTMGQFHVDGDAGNLWDLKTPYIDISGASHLSSAGVSATSGAVIEALEAATATTTTISLEPTTTTTSVEATTTTTSVLPATTTT